MINFKQCLVSKQIIFLVYQISIKYLQKITLVNFKQSWNSTYLIRIKIKHNA